MAKFLLFSKWQFLAFTFCACRCPEKFLAFTFASSALARHTPRMALSSSLTTLFVLIMGVAIVGGLAGLLCRDCVREQEFIFV